jgi:hypothetical protein
MRRGCGRGTGRCACPTRCRSRAALACDAELLTLDQALRGIGERERASG